jgi:outer membrane protein insertion porin family
LKVRYYSLVTIFTILILSSCVSPRHLREGQYLLTGQRVKGNNTVSSADLGALYRQDANTKILGLTPGLFFYRFGERFYDSAKVANKLVETQERYDREIEAERQKDPAGRRIVRLENRRERRVGKLETRVEEGNWIMRRLGQAPVIYDSTLSHTTAEQMRLYNLSQGFFNSRVTFERDTNHSRRHIAVTYHVNEYLPHTLRNIEYVSTDSSIRRLLRDNLADASIHAGQRYKEPNFSEERERINRLLRNNGYFGFGRDYISFLSDTSVADTALGDRLIDVRAIIANPPRGRHNVYKYNTINFVLDASPTSSMVGQPTVGSRDTLQYNNINFYSYTRRHPYAILDRKLRFHPGDIYTDVDVTNTQSQLNSMDMFRFVNLRFDTTAADGITTWIYTSRLPKYQISDEVGLIVSQGAPGPFVNLTFKVRDFLGGYEILELSARYSDEGQLSPNRGEDVFVYRARELGLNASLLFPEFLMPARLQAPFLRYNPKSRLTLGFTNINRPEYTRRIGRTSLSYLMQLSTFSTLSISPVDVSFIQTPRIDTIFQDQLERLQRQGNSIIESFARGNLVSSLSSFYLYNTNIATAESRRAVYFKVSAEAGGLTPHLINSFTNQPAGNLGGLTYFQFVRTDLDWRFYRPVTTKGTFATRIHTGIARYLGVSNTLPYEKFFFIGGGNSIRAWAPRRLGPGSYTPLDPVTGEVNRNIEQPGEILIEINNEWRQKIIGFLEGALFVDAGNIWTFRTQRQGDEAGAGRPGSDFQLNRFYQEIAVGTGAGVRLDFSFLIIRFDFGVKVYDPTRQVSNPDIRFIDQERFRLNKLNGNLRSPFESDLVLQIGIGYPF